MPYTMSGYIHPFLATVLWAHAQHIPGKLGKTTPFASHGSKNNTCSSKKSQRARDDSKREIVIWVSM